MGRRKEELKKRIRMRPVSLGGSCERERFSTESPSPVGRSAWIDRSFRSSEASAAPRLWQAEQRDQHRWCDQLIALPSLINASDSV